MCLKALDFGLWTWVFGFWDLKRDFRRRPLKEQTPKAKDQVPVLISLRGLRHTNTASIMPPT